LTEKEQAHDAGFTTPDAQILYGAAQQGGIKTVMQGIADMTSNN
jgi:hypothetical protein